MEEVLGALTKLVEVLFDKLGPVGTIVVGVVVLAVLVARRIYYDKRADKDRNEALEEKDRTIQRLANEARSWRIFVAVNLFDLSEDEANRLFLENDYGPQEMMRELGPGASSKAPRRRRR